MDRYFERLAQRSDVEPAASVTTTDAPQHPGDGLEQYVEVSVAPADSAGAVTPPKASAAPETMPASPQPAVVTSAGGEPPLNSHSQVRPVPLYDNSLAQNGGDTQSLAALAVQRGSTRATTIVHADIALPDARQTLAPPRVQGTPERDAPRPAADNPKPPRPHASALPPRDALTVDTFTESFVPTTHAVAQPAYAEAALTGRAKRADSDALDSGAIPAAPQSPTRAQPLPSARTAEAPLTARPAPAVPQVQIGRIELEVRQNALSAPVVSAPVESPQAPPRAAVFNPHRHYLRGV